MSKLEVFPKFPEPELVVVGIAELADVNVDGTNTIDFTQFFLKLPEFDANLHEVITLQDSEGTLDMAETSIIRIRSTGKLTKDWI